MPGTVITGSPNISLLDSRVIADLCLGKFYIDASPSIFIGSGALNIKGIKIRITNPYGVIIKDYGNSYDIDDPTTSPIVTIYQQNIPTQATVFQYGVYTVSLQLTDANLATYEVTKSINVCTYNKDQNPCDDRLQLIASCKNGTLTVYLSEPPVFKNVLSESRTQTIVVKYPTGTLAPLTSSNGSFSVQLFTGVYIVSATVCAQYNFGDNILLRLPYAVTIEKNVRCLLDYTCIWPRIKQLNDKISEDCSEADNQLNASIVLDALRLIKTAELANDAGEDGSQYIDDLEKLLGCTCTCDCSLSPIVNGTPSTDLVIEGCGIDKTTVGLTDIYTINNYKYLVTVDPTQNVITVSGQSLVDCIYTQNLSFSIANAYTGIKNQVNSSTEYNFWAGIIYQALTGLDVTCLTGPITTFKQLEQAIINRACAGGTCNATISNIVIIPAGSDSGPIGIASNIKITWDIPVDSDAFAVQIFVDGLLVGTVLASVQQFDVRNGADGLTHTYVLVPVCANGSGGTTSTGVFNQLGCPTIAPPVVSSNNVNGVSCPYDLTSLVSAPPVGISTEWHTAYNTLAATLVPNPTGVSSGVYYAFSKNGDGCYSTATIVTLICNPGTSCTMPLALSVTEVLKDFRIVFDSSMFPPPGNSYTVKRRLFSSPDVPGSYTTIGTPVYNVTLNKWVITDTTGLDNTLYVYRAISNCGGSPMTTPYTDFIFANITCATVTLTPNYTSVGYSFVPVGGGVDKYLVRIYDSTGTILLHTDTILPAFPNPVTGTFIYLSEGTDYRVELTVLIGTYSNVCAQQTFTTLAH